eukprot:11243006-Ditylum_brightwellii.AAC.1
MDVTKHGSLHPSDIRYPRFMSDATKKENIIQDKMTRKPPTSRVAKGILIIPPNTGTSDEHFDRELLSPNEYALDNDDEVERDKNHLQFGAV